MIDSTLSRPGIQVQYHVVPCQNEGLGTMTIYIKLGISGFSLYQGKKLRITKSRDQQKCDYNHVIYQPTLKPKK